MFHTFETSHSTSPDHGANRTKRRTSTVRACEPCRKRKIRCNGEHPCETCQWYRKAAACHYTEPRQRQIPSRRSIEQISTTLQEYRGVLQKLFPLTHPDQLGDLPRDKLIDLIAKNSPSLPQPPSPLTPGFEEKPSVTSQDATTLESLQPMPQEDGSDYAEHRPKALRGITDDVNALSLSTRPSSSYLGISSVMAVLRVIVWLDPESQAFFTKTPDRSAMTSRAASSPPEGMDHKPESIPSMNSNTSSQWTEIPLINAYFQYIHPFVPLIEENLFRDTYMASTRIDSRWKLLLNVVLALGSMVASTSDDSSHQKYYERAKQHFNLETLASAHLETVQALALLAGWYLHYIQQPTLASAIMGVTFRLALTVGLHRDYPEGVSSVEAGKAKKSVEMRRRVWWSCFMMDSWANASTGRPSMGRSSNAITAKPPQEPIGESIPMLTLFQEKITFAYLSTRLEDALAVSPLIPEAVRRSLDTAMVDWFKSSSVQINTPRPYTVESAGMLISKNVLRWRYLSSRILLHRPVMLWYAMRKLSLDSLPGEKKEAVTICRDVTAELINDISTTWQAQKPCLMSGWNATWLLYQAAMVPLLLLFSDTNDIATISKSQAQVEITLKTLSNMFMYSSTAKRSYEVISRIYEASKRHFPNVDDPDVFNINMDQNLAHPRPTHIDASVMNSEASNIYQLQGLNSVNQELFMDNMFDSLNWSTGWPDQDFPFETPTLGWDLTATNGWNGAVGLDGYFDPFPAGGSSGNGNSRGSAVQDPGRPG